MAGLAISAGAGLLVGAMGEYVFSACVHAAAATNWKLTYAALSPGSQLFGPTLIAGTDAQEVALTYDDGPNDNATDSLLEILARHNARATFFMIGNFVRQRPEIVRRVQAAGHLIGNHTQTHPWLHTKPERVIREELGACRAALEDVLGEPVRYFRAPHGARRPAVLRVAHEIGMTTVQWNVMAKDWQSDWGRRRCWRRWMPACARCRRRGVGANVLLHDGHE